MRALPAPATTTELYLAAVLEELVVLRSALQGAVSPADTVASPATGPVDSSTRSIGPVALGGGWYEVNGVKVQGLTKAMRHVA